MAARNFFSSQSPTDVINNLFVTSGGPIVRNKTFFLGHFDGQRRPRNAPNTFNTPTLAMRQGDYSLCCDPITDPASGQPFANNMIPQDRIAQSALAYQDRFFALPEGTDANNPRPSRNFNRNTPSDRTDWAYGARIDHQLSSKNNFSRATGSPTTTSRIRKATCHRRLPIFASGFATRRQSSSPIRTSFLRTRSTSSGWDS